MSKITSHKSGMFTAGRFFLIIGLVFVLTAAVPGGLNLDGGGFPTPTPTDAPALAPEPSPTETPTLIPVESILPEATPTLVILPDNNQPASGADSFVASSDVEGEEQDEGGINLLLLGIPILGVLTILVIVVGFYLRRSREIG